MRVLRSARWLLLALLLSLVPASSYAGVFISVGFAPPVLPVYVQPPCPEPGLMWTPGYWAYGDEGYYWVPGAWVPAPYEGALWTPPYWGWDGGLYVFHTGYWGPHVGYYGGVNYGFGYMGVGFVGGEWRGREFAYNTAVMNVNRTVIRNVYVNRTIVHNTTIMNDRHVAYAGGPGGIRHDPSAQERVAMRESHLAPTSFQQQHFDSARTNHANYFNANHGRPQNVAIARPLPAEHHSMPMAGSPNAGGRGNFDARPAGGNGNAAAGVNARPAPGVRPENRPSSGYQPQQRPTPGFQGRANQTSQTGAQARPTTQPRFEQPQSRPTPQSHAAPQYQARPAAPQQQARPAPQSRPEQSRPASQARPESHESRPHR